MSHPRTPRNLPYEDVGGALDWLAEVFGFPERLWLAEDDGLITHAEMELAGG